MYAILLNNIEIVKLLIQKGANINLSCGAENYTPLLIAINEGHEDIIKLLIKEKVNINIRGGLGLYTPLELAEISFPKIKQLLITNGAV